MSAEMIPNRTDRLLLVISDTPTEDLTGSQLVERMRDVEGFGTFPLRGILESLAHLEENGRIVFAPQFKITDEGKCRLADTGLAASS